MQYHKMHNAMHKNRWMENIANQSLKLLNAICLKGVVHF